MKYKKKIVLLRKPKVINFHSMFYEVQKEKNI
jgi:hypothetical protein